MHVAKPNDAGQWSAADDAQHETETLSARPLYQPGSALSLSCVKPQAVTLTAVIFDAPTSIISTALDDGENVGSTVFVYRKIDQTKL
jgi:hypothetical protein